MPVARLLYSAIADTDNTSASEELARQSDLLRDSVSGFSLLEDSYDSSGFKKVIEDENVQMISHENQEELRLDLAQNALEPFSDLKIYLNQDEEESNKT